MFFFKYDFSWVYFSYAVFTEAAGIPSPSWPLSVELLESGEHWKKQNPRDDAPPQLLGGGPGRAQRGGGGGRQLLDRERGGRLQPDLPPAQGGHLCFKRRSTQRLRKSHLGWVALRHYANKPCPSWPFGLCLGNVLNVKALVAAFNQEKALVGAFSLIIQLCRLIVNSSNLSTLSFTPDSAVNDIFKYISQFLLSIVTLHNGNGIELDSLHFLQNFVLLTVSRGWNPS